MDGGILTSECDVLPRDLPACCVTVETWCIDSVDEEYMPYFSSVVC